MLEKYQDISLPIEERVEDLLGKMTLAEKTAQMLFASIAVDRLGIPEYNWWNECLHGVARAGIATVFPQAIGLAAMFDEVFMETVATAVSDEARAKHNEYLSINDRGIYKGLTFWSPNINIFRDPRWGRGHETYGEDPYLTARTGIAFIKGLQGDHPVYRKLDATIKHFAVHSGPEGKRHEIDVKIEKKQMVETYLYAFKECINEADASAVMGAYNRVNGEPCCGSRTLLTEILRNEWGFKGYVVSDCGAICDFHLHHKITDTADQSAAMAVNNGCDLNCGDAFKYLQAAVAQGLISEENIDNSVRRLLYARFRLGMFDSPKDVPYNDIPPEVIDCDAHRELALKAAQKSVVLLKNDNMLPLGKNTKTIAVIGPNAYSKDVLLGNYNGTPSSYVTVVEGIRNKAGRDTKILYAEGCDLVTKKIHPWAEDALPEALITAAKSDAVVLCIGLSPRIEGEEGDAFNADASGDRINIDLPGRQLFLLEEIKKLGKPVTVVLLNGSAIAMPEAAELADAIIEAWYPGEEGGNAVADVVFGNYNPGGRLPITFVNSVFDLPDFEDYDMKGRTYRFIEKEPLFPFGFGLSFTKFAYSDLLLNTHNLQTGDDLVVSVDVENTGKGNGEEVVQIYLKDIESSVLVPNFQLVGFQRIELRAGEKKKLTFTIKARQISVVTNEGEVVQEPGDFYVYAGGIQPDTRSVKLAGYSPLCEKFTLC